MEDSKLPPLLPGVRFPMNYRHKLVHKMLAKSLELDVDAIFLKFKLHQLTRAYEGHEPRSLDWDETFSDYLREAYRYEQKEKTREVKTDMPLLRKPYVTQTQADAMLNSMMKDGRLKYDGTLYKDTDRYVVSPPKAAKVAQNDLDMEKLSGLDRQLVEDLKRMFPHDWQEYYSYQRLLQRYNHPGYAEHAHRDDEMMDNLALEPNIGLRMTTLQAYLKERNAVFFDDMPQTRFDEKLRRIK